MKKLITLSLALSFVILSFAQSQRLVLFEEFTGENCPPCASINPYVDAIATQAASEVVLIHYIAPIPTPGTLSRQVSAVVNGRMSYYGVNSTPWGQEDGLMWDSSLLANDGNNPATWCTNAQGYLSSAYVDAEYAVPSPFTISVTDTLTGVTDSFYATVKITASEAITFTGTLKLEMAMVENLNFNAAPGNNGETSWSNAVRAMYPSYIGTTLTNTWTNGQVAVYTFKGKMPAFIRDQTQVRFVAFVQNTIGAPLNNKDVQQTGISPYFTFKTDISTTGVQGNFSNCYSAQYTPVVNIGNAGTQTISSCNVLRYLDNVFVDSVAWSGSLTTGSTTTTTLAPMTLTSGVHKLSITLSRPNHSPDQNLGNDSASVMINVPIAQVTTPLIEGFENGDPIAAGWAVEAPDHDSTWRVVNSGQTSTHSYMVDYYDDLYNDFVGPIDNFYSPPLDLTYAAKATVKFSFANQWVDFGGGSYGWDSLGVDVSTDCGNTWTNVYSTNVATATPAQSVNTAVPFVPTSGQWKTDSANISIAANHPDVLVRFRPQSFDGNNFYLDNINIYKYDSVPYTPSGVVLVSGIQSVSVFPNPSNAQINVSVQLENAAAVRYEVTDLTGQIVFTAPAQVSNAGLNQFQINTTTLAEGAYLVNIFAGSDRTSKMISVIH